MVVLDNGIAALIQSRPGPAFLDRLPDPEEILGFTSERIDTPTGPIAVRYLALPEWNGPTSAIHIGNRIFVCSTNESRSRMLTAEIDDIQTAEFEELLSFPQGECGGWTAPMADGSVWGLVSTGTTTLVYRATEAGRLQRVGTDLLPPKTISLHPEADTTLALDVEGRVFEAGSDGVFRLRYGDEALAEWGLLVGHKGAPWMVGVDRRVRFDPYEVLEGGLGERPRALTSDGVRIFALTETGVKAMDPETGVVTEFYVDADLARLEFVRIAAIAEGRIVLALPKPSGLEILEVDSEGVHPAVIDWNDPSTPEFEGSVPSVRLKAYVSRFLDTLWVSGTRRETGGSDVSLRLTRWNGLLEGTRFVDEEIASIAATCVDRAFFVKDTTTSDNFYLASEIDVNTYERDQWPVQNAGATFSSVSVVAAAMLNGHLLAVGQDGSAYMNFSLFPSATQVLAGQLRAWSAESDRAYFQTRGQQVWEVTARP